MEIFWLDLRKGYYVKVHFSVGDAPIPRRRNVGLHKEEAAMLYLTLREGDYVMVGGNVKVSYSHANGKDSFVLGFEAPKDVQILRGKYYEEEIAKMAAKGSEAAQKLSDTLSTEYEARRSKYNARRASRNNQERRISAGEIKPYSHSQLAEHPDEKQADDKVQNLDNKVHSLNYPLPVKNKKILKYIKKLGSLAEISEEKMHPGNFRYLSASESSTIHEDAVTWANRLSDYPGAASRFISSWQATVNE